MKVRRVTGYEIIRNCMVALFCTYLRNDFHFWLLQYCNNTKASNLTVSYIMNARPCGNHEIASANCFDSASISIVYNSRGNRILVATDAGA